MSSESADAWPAWAVCSIAELDDPGARGFLVGGGDWPFRGFVVRQGGEVYAYANVCPHRRHPLDLVPDNFLVDAGRLLRCASHGALFEPDTGRCVYGPCHGRRLMNLRCWIDGDVVRVRAPASLLDAGSIIETS